jgi:hypothetical protein
MTRLKRKLISVRLEIVLILMKDRCTVCIERTIGSKLMWTHPIELLGTWVMSSVILVCLETELVSVQDKCTVCAKRTIGAKIIFDAPDGTPR